MADTRRREAIAADYHAARASGEVAAMRRFQNEEACLVLLTILGRLDLGRSNRGLSDRESGFSTPTGSRRHRTADSRSEFSRRYNTG